MTFSIGRSAALLAAATQLSFLGVAANAAPALSEQDEDDVSCAVASQIVLEYADADQKPAIEKVFAFFKASLSARHGAKDAGDMITNYYTMLLSEDGYADSPEDMQIDAEEQYFRRCEPQAR